MKQSFEEFIREKCPDELQTNNSPEGEDRWIEQLDVQELIDFAEEYGSKEFARGFTDGQVAGMNTANMIYGQINKSNL